MWQPNPWKAENDILRRSLEAQQVAAAGNEDAQRRLRREQDAREARYQRRKPWLHLLTFAILALMFLGLLTLRGL